MENQPIQIQQINSFYGTRQILFDVDLSVAKKEIMVIMGHSGSGKSTLLRHMLGLKAATSGSISILEQDWNSLDTQGQYALRKRIGMAFQGGALFSSMSLRENVELPLREHTNLDDATIKIMARMKLEVMRLGQYENLMPAELSGGMLKRAGLARAVVMDPELLFFDEPSAGLDPVTSAELDELILQLRDAFNMTIVVVTHEMESAFNIADKMAIMDKGKIILTGTPDEIRASDDSRIINMLERKPAYDDLSADDYLNQLTA